MVPNLGALPWVLMQLREKLQFFDAALKIRHVNRAVKGMWHSLYGRWLPAVNTADNKYHRVIIFVLIMPKWVYHYGLSKRNPVLVIVITCTSYLQMFFFKQVQEETWGKLANLSLSGKWPLKQCVCIRSCGDGNDYHVPLQCHCYPSVCWFIYCTVVCCFEQLNRFALWCLHKVHFIFAFCSMLLIQKNVHIVCNVYTWVCEFAS